MRPRNLIRRTSWIVPLLVGSMWLLASVSAASDDDDDAPKFGPWSAPVNLGPPVSALLTGSPPLGAELNPSISKNGLSLYFASDRAGGFGGFDIWVSQRPSVNDPWGEPQNLGPNINTPFQENSPTLTIDGHRLFFQSNRPGGFGGLDLYVSRRHNKRDDLGWQPAENLGSGVNTVFGEAGSAYFEDEVTGTITLYFQSDRPGGIGGNDIYASTLQPDDTFGPAILVPELSSPFADQGLGIRRDGLEILFVSNRPGSLGGSDIWVSTRPSTLDPWLEPVNLGPVINTSFQENRPGLSFKGTELYFASNRPSPGGFDIYVSTRAKLPEPDDDKE